MILLLLQLARESAPARPTIEPPRIDTTVAVDGRLDEAVWSQAARLGGFHQYRPVDRQPAEQQTEVLMWYSPNAIYFGIIAHDRNPGSIRATVADRDKIGEDDRVLVLLDTFNDRRRAFAFGANPFGIQEDGVRTEGGGGRGSGGGGSAIGFDRSPDFIYYSKGVVTDSGYVVEMRIPFKSLRYPGGQDLTWGFNVVRATQRSGFEDTWTDVRRGGTAFLAQSALIKGLSGIKRGVVTEIQPFVTASADGVVDSLTGVFGRESLRPDYGLNLRLGFTSLAVDATVNPDFSQIESDAGRITLNERFALFFDERRPFFLEGIELFQTPNSLVYTRQVGSPIAGGKITGKFGRLGIAHLTAVDEIANDTTSEISRPLVNVTRVRTDIGQNSLAGFTFTDRTSGSKYSRVVSADSRLVWKTIYAVNTSIGKSWVDDGTTARDGAIWSVGFDRTGRRYGFSYGLDGKTPDFEAALGFVPRVDNVNLRLFNRYSLFGRPGSLFEGITFFAGFNRLWDYGGFGNRRPLEGDQSLSGFGRLRGGWSYGFTTRLGFVDFDPDYYYGATVESGGQQVAYLGPARLDRATDLQLDLSTPNLPTGSAFVRVQRRDVAIFSEASKGRELQLSGSAELRPHRWVRLQGSGTYSRLTRARDGSEFGRTLIPRVRVEMQPNRFFLVRLIGEYRAERRAELRSAIDGQILSFDGVASEASSTNRFRVDALLSYQPAPGTVAFFGYGAGYDGSRPLTFRNLVRQDDGFFMKLAYQIRR